MFPFKGLEAFSYGYRSRATPFSGPFPLDPRPAKEEALQHAGGGDLATGHQRWMEKIW